MSTEAFRAHFASFPRIADRATAVTFTDGCWEMPGGTYARLWTGKRTFQYVHRLSLEIAQGEPLGALYACHSCDNPPCVNPAHLFPATCRDNLIDMHRKGRHRAELPSGEAHPHVTVSDADVARAIARVRAGETRTSVADDLGVTRKALYNWIHGNARRGAA